MPQIMGLEHRIADQPPIHLREPPDVLVRHGRPRLAATPPTPRGPEQWGVRRHRLHDMGISWECGTRGFPGLVPDPVRSPPGPRNQLALRTLYHSIARSQRSHWERHSNPVRSGTEHGAAPQWARPWWNVLWGIARQAPVQGATRHHDAAGGGKEARCLRLRTRCTSALIGAPSLTRSPCSTPSEGYWANAPLPMRPWRSTASPSG